MMSFFFFFFFFLELGVYCLPAYIATRHHVLQGRVSPKVIYKRWSFKGVLVVHAVTIYLQEAELRESVG